MTKKKSMYDQSFCKVFEWVIESGQPIELLEVFETVMSKGTPPDLFEAFSKALDNLEGTVPNGLQGVDGDRARAKLMDRIRSLSQNNLER